MTQRLCKDCRWLTWSAYGKPCCENPLLKAFDPIVGHYQKEVPCLEMRNHAGQCGPEGKLFEPKLPLWRRLLRRLGK